MVEMNQYVQPRHKRTVRSKKTMVTREVNKRGLSPVQKALMVRTKPARQVQAPKKRGGRSRD